MKKPSEKRCGFCGLIVVPMTGMTIDDLFDPRCECREALRMDGEILQNAQTDCPVGSVMVVDEKQCGYCGSGS